MSVGNKGHMGCPLKRADVFISDGDGIYSPIEYASVETLHRFYHRREKRVEHGDYGGDGHAQHETGHAANVGNQLGAGNVGRFNHFKLSIRIQSDHRGHFLQL